MTGGDDCVDTICGWLKMTGVLIVLTLYVADWWWQVMMIVLILSVVDWWWQWVMIVLALYVADWRWQGWWLCWHYMWLTEDDRWWWLCWYYLWVTGDDEVMMIVLIFFCGWVMMTGGCDCVDIMCGWLMMTGVMIVLTLFVGDWWWWRDDDCVDIFLWLSDDDRG